MSRRVWLPGLLYNIAMRHRWVAVLVASVVGAAIPGALAIAGDRITLVGTDDAVRARAGASTQMT